MKQLRWWRKPEKPLDKADLGRYFTALRNQEPADSFSDVKDWINSLEMDNSPSKQHLNVPLSPMKIFLKTHKVRLIVTSLILAVSVISCTTPVEQEETVGFMISGKIESKQALSAMHKISALDWLEPGQLDLGVVSTKQIKENAEGVSAPSADVELERKEHQFVIALPQADEDEAESHANDLEQIEGIHGVEIERLQITSEQPAYKVVLNAFRDSERMLELHSNREKINAAVEKYLEDLEMYGVEITQGKDEKGNYTLALSPPDGMNKPGLITLKRFLEEAAVANNQLRSKNPDDMTKSLVLVQKQIAEIELRISQADREQEQQKLQMTLAELQAKYQALQKAQNQ